MVPLIIESDSDRLIQTYLTEHYYLSHLVSEVKPENGSIGLPAIKFLIDRAKFAPASHSQLVFLIYSGHLITPAGQNALLKTLEESKPEEQFIITTTNHHLLLPTIQSRCQLIHLTDADQKPPPDVLKNLVAVIATSPAKLIAFADKLLADNPKAKLDQIIATLQMANRTLPTIKRVKIIDLALTAKNDLGRNINPKLTLDHFLLRSAHIASKKDAKMNPASLK